MLASLSGGHATPAVNIHGFQGVCTIICHIMPHGWQQNSDMNHSPQLFSDKLGQGTIAYLSVISICQ
ncbi:MAG: hypothetical protein IH835_00595 [Proteobacteria bacterium]|nr:hypothetical protein [Pseudomonadota bacterium]